jgi:hypothetical protein
MDHYTPMFPTVVQQQGVELSENTPHLKWFGSPEIWPAADPANSDIALAISKVHAAGGVASYNHPFGTTAGGTYPSAVRTDKRRTMASTMVSERAFGADVVEVGFTGGRAGMAQSDYIALWDVMSRNLVFATGTGTTDDHRGVDWTGQIWRHVTGVWARSTNVAHLQAALRAGRAGFFDPAAFKGTIDVVGAGFVPMGSAGMVNTDKAQLMIRTTGVPPDWTIVVVSGIADEAGTSLLDPQVTTKAIAASELVNGSVKVRVPSTVNRFHRVMLRDPSGVVQAYSNPLWLLRTTPGATVPAQRLAVPGTTPTPSDSPSDGGSTSASSTDSASPSDTPSESPSDPASGEPSDTATDSPAGAPPGSPNP